MNTIILTSYLDFYEKDEQGNKIAHNFGNDNGILDCLKSNIKKHDNFVFVANGMEGEKAEAYFKLACNSFELTLPFNNYEFLCPSTKNRAKEMIEKADFIFLCGGHLPTQNKFFNDIGLKELWRGNGNSVGVSVLDVSITMNVGMIKNSVNTIKKQYSRNKLRERERFN